MNVLAMKNTIMVNMPFHVAYDSDEVIIRAVVPV